MDERGLQPRTFLPSGTLSAGDPAPLEVLVEDLIHPPLPRIGQLPINDFLSKTQSKHLAAALNNLLASPTFSSWRTGASLDVEDGETFSFAAIANTADENITIDASGDPDCPGGTCTNATIAHEVSTIVEDIDDPGTEARWKIFTHSYVILEPDPVDPNTPRLRYQFGHIRVGTAPAPAGPWSNPVPLIGWPSASPLSSDAPELVTDIDGLEDCVALTEPSAVIDEASGALELAVGCVFPLQADFGIRVELLRSLDHGRTWSHAHVLLDASDAPCVGGVGPELNAAHLFSRNGQSYLLASPAGPVTLPGGATGSGYRGCLLFARTADGVERDAAGAPIVLGRLDPGAGIAHEYLLRGPIENCEALECLEVFRIGRDDR